MTKKEEDLKLLVNLHRIIEKLSNSKEDNKIKEYLKNPVTLALGVEILKKKINS
tara:strand:- start:149 stop:310 length:162 start_codon:yes stop_codon:yes gene_type:complete